MVGKGDGEGDENLPKLATSSKKMFFVIPGHPVHQERHREFIVGGHVNRYNPTRAKKEEVRKRLQDFCLREGVKFFNSPLVSFLFFFPVPAGYGKVFHKKIQEIPILHKKKPDADNLEKFYLDAMSGYFWKDDCKCQLGYGVKMHGHTPHTIVQVCEWELDQPFSSLFPEQVGYKIELGCDKLSHTAIFGLPDS